MNGLIITAALVALIIIGVIIDKKSEYGSVFGILIYVLTGFMLIIHLICWSISGYQYHICLVERNAIQSTIDYGRTNEKYIESAAILSKISDFNKELAEYKYNNTTWILDCYIDDRVINMEPIK